MDCDGLQIIEAFKKVRKYMLEVADKIKEIFKDNEDSFLRLMEIIKDFYEIENNKVKYKPVLEIKAKKERLIDKRNNNYYCRNNL